MTSVKSFLLEKLMRPSMKSGLPSSMKVRSANDVPYVGRVTVVRGTLEVSCAVVVPIYGNLGGAACSVRSLSTVKFFSVAVTA